MKILYMKVGREKRGKCRKEERRRIKRTGK
jgi:hypothetical protein